MTPGLWRHKYFKDVDMFVHRVAEELPDKFGVLVSWYDRKGRFIAGPERVDVPRIKMWKWERVGD